MKNPLRRVLSLVMCIMIAAGTIAVGFPAMPVLAASADISVQNGTGTNTPVKIAKTYSYRAIVNGSFTGFAFSMPTWSTNTAGATLSMYKWNGTYEKTVAGKPIAEKVFDPLTDGAHHWVTFDAQPAGEYLFHITDPKGEAGVWTNVDPTDSKGFLYENGLEGRGEPNLVIRFSEAVAEPFGTCEPSTDPRIPQYPTVNGTGQSVTEVTQSEGLRLNVAVPFSGVQFMMATYHRTDLEMTYSVYEWKGTFTKTVAESPKVSARFLAVDNAMQGIEFDKLPAGDYLFLVHDANYTPAMFHYTEVDDFKGEIYKDGVAQDASVYPQCNIIFSEEAETYFLPCEKAEDAVDGNHMAPEESEIPKDSLIYTHEVMPDTWVFTDGLGRVSLTNQEVGDRRTDKTLAMFYWTWHTDNFTAQVPNNLQELSEKYPEAMNDYDHPMWATVTDEYFWNEPIYGYYRSDDEWVLRRQAELLANAGVDVIFSDNTNGTLTWRSAYTKLLDTWSAAREDGVLTPKYSFTLPFAASDFSKTQIQNIYLDMYRQGKWQDLWYYLDGKPMLLASTDNMSKNNSLTEKEILNFFTFRSCAPMSTNDKPLFRQWSWLSMYPQTAYYGDIEDYDNKNPEQMAVSVSQNFDYKIGMMAAMNGKNITGRSYTSDMQDRYAQVGREASKWGYNFAEQWNYALQIDPQIIYITGWNEWRVDRAETWPAGWESEVENGFADQFNDEFSRDIEPTKGALQDHYYYQLVNFSRQYQGARPIPTPSVNKTIDLSAGAEQWKTVEPYYAAYIGNTDDRNAQGYGDLVYTETSGRNDIIGAQVARDDEFVYFHVECAADITPYTDALWMHLYIDATGNGALDGWNSFDYVVNKTAPTATTAVLEKFTGDGYATEKVADVEYKVDGRTMTVKIAKSALGLSGNDYTVNFAWTDNVHDEGDYTRFSGDIMDFYISGDVAPGGRFKYSYISTAENAGSDVSVETETETEAPDESATEAPEETKVPEETTSETLAETEAPGKSGGCASTMNGMAAVLLFGGAALCRKRKRSSDRL